MLPRSPLYGGVSAQSMPSCRANIAARSSSSTPNPRKSKGSIRFASAPSPGAARSCLLTACSRTAVAGSSATRRRPRPRPPSARSRRSRPVLPFPGWSRPRPPQPDSRSRRRSGTPRHLDRRHFHATAHPIIEGYDPPEGWGWCYVDEVMLSDRATPQDGPIRRYY
jgi:hypothetical protein